MTNTQDAALTPLMDAAAIRKIAVETHDDNFPSQPQPLVIGIATTAMRTLSEAYEAERKQLHDQLAAATGGTWQPIENGEYAPGITVDNAMLAILESDENSEQVWVATFLPDDLRLCRRQATPTEAQHD